MGGMDGKTKKILNHLKKDGGELEMLDIAFALNMEENYVQNTLETLSQQGLVIGARNEHGKTFWRIGDDAPKSTAAPKTKPAKAKGKAAPDIDDDAEEFMLEDQAMGAGIETIAVSVEEEYRFQTQKIPTVKSDPIPTDTSSFIVSAAAQAMPTTQTIPALPPTQSIRAVPPVSAPVPEIADDFEPKPEKKPKRAKREKAPAADDDFEPKPAKESASEPKSAAAAADDDDFAAKPSGGGISISSIAAASAAALVISLGVGMMTGGGKNAEKIIEAAKSEIAQEAQVSKSASDAKFTKLEEDCKALAAKVDSLETEVKKLTEAGKKTAAGKKGRGKR